MVYKYSADLDLLVVLVEPHGCIGREIHRLSTSSSVFCMKLFKVFLDMPSAIVHVLLSSNFKV